MINNVGDEQSGDKQARHQLTNLINVYVSMCDRRLTNGM